MPKPSPRVLACREDLGRYMALVHRTDTAGVMGGYAVPARHHREMIRALTETDEHTVIVTPRGSGKTTLIQAWLEWRLGRASLRGGNWAEEFRAIFVANTATQAYKISNAIKNTVEFNEDFRAIFPKVRPYKDKWSEAEWRVQGNERQKDPTFQAFGISGPALGSRASDIVLDDIGDRENMATAYQRDQIRYTLTHTFKPILVPGGRMVMLATRWAWDDPPAWAIEQGWKQIYLKALDEGESYWPERFPVGFLEKERDADPVAFARQYQNEVAPEEGLVFERWWFENRFDTPPSPVLFAINSWDTAFGQGRNRSYSAGLSAVVTPDWHVYITHLMRGQVPYWVLLKSVEVLAERSKPRFIIIEKKQSGHALVQDQRLRHLPVVEFQPFGQKGSPTRQEANQQVASICQTGRVHLPSEFFCRRSGDPAWIHDFEREVFSYPDGESDDIVDALCQLLFWVEEQRMKHQHLLQQPRMPLRWGSPGGRRVAV